MSDPAALRQQLQTAEAEWVAERLNLEQLLHQCERERDELVTSQARSQTELSTSKLELEQSRGEIRKLKQELEQVHDRLDRLQTAKNELATDLDAERARSAQLVTRNATVEAEVDRVREDCSRYSERQIELIKQLNETERALAMEKALVKPVKIQLGDAEQRQKLLENQNELLQKELESCSEQLIQLQRTHGAQIGELSNAKESLAAQCKEWESRCQASTEEINTLKIKLTEALNQVQEEQNACVNVSCQYQSELDSEKRLSATLKRSLHEAKQSIAELESIVEAMRADCKAATDRARVLEEKHQAAVSALRISEENVDKMRHELEAVQHQHRSPLPIELPGKVTLKGVKIEDLYSRLMQTNQLLIEERAKSRKLQLYLEQIEEEIQEQAPLLKERQDDIQNLVKVNNSLALRVKEANYQRDLLERKVQEALQRAESEHNQRQELIQYIKSQGIEGFNENSSMQLSVVSQEDTDVNSWRRLVQQLEEELKKRDLQLARVETEIRSRNLLAVATPDANHVPTNAVAVVPAASPSENHDKKLIDELRQQVEILQSEKSASERQLQSTIDDERRRCHELTMKMASTEGSIALLNQKLEWMTSQANRFSVENDKLRAHDSQRDALLTVTQEKISSLNSELAEANQRYSRSSIQLQQIRAQLDLARQTEQRLTEQCGDMAALRQHNEQLLATMQSVQEKLETGQSANVQQLMSEKERIYQDMLQAQKQASVERRTFQQNIKILEEQCQSLQSQLEVANKATEEANTKLSQLLAAANAAESAHVKLLEELRAVKHERDLLASHAQADEESGGRQLMIELAHSQAEAQSLLEKVSALTSEANEWKMLCEQRAKLLDELEDNLRAQRQRSDDDIDTLRNRVEELTEQCRKCDQQYEDLLAQLEQKDSLSVSQAKELQQAVTDAERRASHAEEQFKISQQIADSKEQEAADYRKRYESELTGHAGAITALNAVRDELSAVRTQLEASRQTESDAVEALNAIQQQSQSDINNLSEHLKQARETVANLTKKNDLLLAQIETGRFTNSAEGGEGEEEAIRTRQIITFLRSEKEIAEAEAESASRQIVRLKTEVEQLQWSLESARTEISKLQERELSMQVDAEKTPLENAAVLLESNQMLRSQKVELMAQLKELEERFAQLQQDSGPMQSQIAELNATVLTLQAEKSALQEDVERWKSRNQQILSRYNQVDPELYRQAKEALAESKQEVEQLHAKLQAKETQITELQEKLARANQGQANIETIRKSAVFNLQQVNALKRELQNRPDPAQFISQLSEAQKCIKTLRALCSRSRSVLERRNEAVVNLQNQVDLQKSEISSLNQKASELQDRVSECEDSLQKSEERHAAEMSSSNDQLVLLQQQLTEATDRSQTVMSDSTPSVPTAERSDDFNEIPQKRPSSPVLQPAQKKMKPLQSDESVPMVENQQPLQSLPAPDESQQEPQEQHPEKQSVSEKQSLPEKNPDEPMPIPIRRLRRTRAASSAHESSTSASVAETPSVVPVEVEDGEGVGVAEEESAAATGPGPSSDVEEGEIDDTSDPNNTSMDI